MRHARKVELPRARAKWGPGPKPGVPRGVTAGAHQPNLSSHPTRGAHPNVAARSSAASEQRGYGCAGGGESGGHEGGGKGQGWRLVAMAGVERAMGAVGRGRWWRQGVVRGVGVDRRGGGGSIDFRSTHLIRRDDRQHFRSRLGVLVDRGAHAVLVHLEQARAEGQRRHGRQVVGQ